MIRIFTLVALGMVQAACSNSGASCSEHSDSATLGRSFSQQEYALMFLAIEELVNTDNPGVIFPMTSDIQLPEIIEKLKPQKLTLHTKVPRVNLEGCLDHYVAMHFKGVNSGRRSISLSWGEASDSGSQMLWPLEC